jgi:hypothetical protein
MLIAPFGKNLIRPLIANAKVIVFLLVMDYRLDLIEEHFA